MSVKLNGIPIGENTYPNQERILKDPHIIAAKELNVELKFESDIDIVKLFFISKFIDETMPNLPKFLIMKYIPYSRMDRRINGYMFSLKYFTSLINSLNFDKVYVLDPHSEVSAALIDNVCEFGVRHNIYDILERTNYDYFFFPDAGAMKRYSEQLTMRPFFFGNKKRDLNTGKIIKFELIGAPDLNGKRVLIIDDLCAKGGTFMASAKLIEEAGAGIIDLYVSHCEDSIFEGDILKTDLISTVYTTDSMLTRSHEKIVLLR